MRQNYLKVTLRYLLKHKLHTFINIAGLSIALTISILIFLFVADELSFDQFHSNKNQIYRVEAKRYTYGNEKSFFDIDQDGVWSIPWLPTGLGPALIDEIPDVVHYTRWESGNCVFTYNDKIFQENINYVDPGFFLMFDFDLIHGNPNTVLQDKNNIVITKDIQDKYFEDIDPMGVIVLLDIFGEEKYFIINGVIENPPSNSSLDFDFLIHQENRPYYEENLNNWQSFNNPTFIQLAEKTDLSQFMKKLKVFEDKYFAQEKKEIKEREMVEDDVPVFELLIKPITAIHLDPDVPWHKSSDPMYSYILGGIGLLILLIACINYISLSLGNSSSRAREVGIRKVLGAKPSNLAQQFYGESQFLVFLALISGIILAALFIEPFNKFTQKSISLLSYNTLWFLLFLALITFIIGLIAGGYPAIFLSRFQPVKVLKSHSTTKFNTLLIRGLVIFQYALSGFLIISSMIMYQQMKYITTKDLGYNQEQILVIPTFTGWSDEGEQLMTRLHQALTNKLPIIHVSGTSNSFNKGWSKNGFEINGEEHQAFTYRISPEYLNTLELEIIMGRDFDPNRPSDTKNAIIVNEALVKDFGWENPIGEYLHWRSDSSAFEIVGVVRDYHYLSLENEIEPAILYYSPAAGKISTILVKIRPEDIPGTIKMIEKTWKEINRNKPFEYTFLDDDVANQYSNYERWMNIMSISTILAIFIACLGLFGLSGINAVNRIKEISIRKILGATFNQLFILMNREVIILALLSFFLATPISYFIMNQWLNSFQFKINIGWPLFVIAFLAGIFIAIVAVSYHVIKTMLINPAEILRNE